MNHYTSDSASGTQYWRIYMVNKMEIMPQPRTKSCLSLTIAIPCRKANRTDYVGNGKQIQNAGVQASCSTIAIPAVVEIRFGCTLAHSTLGVHYIVNGSQQ